MAQKKPSFYDVVYRAVCLIPRGRVSTYGRIATLVGSPRASRAVGYALFFLPPERDVPWQRVLNRDGGISFRGDGHRVHLQRQLLEEEGVVFSSDERVDLSLFGWGGPDTSLVWDESTLIDRLT